MSDTTRHDGLEAVTPTEAAQRLGITPDAVRARLRRGTLPGEQHGHEWTVYLSPAETRAESAQDAEQHDTDTTHRATRHDTDTTPTVALIAAKDETISAKDETIARQDAEISFLRDQLEQTRRDQAAERERFDVIHREALQRIEALTSGPVESADDDTDPFAPVTRSEAPGRELPVQGLNTPEHRPSWLLAAWWRLRGRS